MFIKTDDNIEIEISNGSHFYLKGQGHDEFKDWEELESETQDELISLHDRLEVIVREAQRVQTTA